MCNLWQRGRDYLFLPLFVTKVKYFLDSFSLTRSHDLLSAHLGMGKLEDDQIWNRLDEAGTKYHSSNGGNQSVTAG